MELEERAERSSVNGTKSDNCIWVKTALWVGVCVCVCVCVSVRIDIRELIETTTEPIRMSVVSYCRVSLALQCVFSFFWKIDYWSIIDFFSDYRKIIFFTEPVEWGFVGKLLTQRRRLATLKFFSLTLALTRGQKVTGWPIFGMRYLDQLLYDFDNFLYLVCWLVVLQNALLIWTLIDLIS